MINLDKILSLGEQHADPAAPLTYPPLVGLSVDDKKSLWVRLRTAAGILTGRAPNADNIAPGAPIAQDVAAYLHGYDDVGDNWDRARVAGDDSDFQSVRASGVLLVGSRLTGFNANTWDLLRTASRTVQSDIVKTGVLAVAQIGNWSVTSDPAENTVASATQAAGMGFVPIRHVATSIAATLAAGATASAIVKVYLRDGDAGVGAILWSGVMVAPIGTSRGIVLSGLSIVGSENTAMTLEFSAAGGVSTFENVSLTGYSVV